MQPSRPVWLGQLDRAVNKSVAFGEAGASACSGPRRVADLLFGWRVYVPATAGAARLRPVRGDRFFWPRRGLSLLVLCLKASQLRPLRGAEQALALELPSRALRRGARA